jgi:hypothetical protein
LHYAKYLSILILLVFQSKAFRSQPRIMNARITQPISIYLHSADGLQVFAEAGE